ncbi:uncharacterized protein LOC119165623 [Rhipicephalus microplus]|uniref:Putative secreted protein n=1 Tax=Rhipicephalus microplus TaxID=6941 RepID=A0A6M2CMS9_RHIMP
MQMNRCIHLTIGLFVVALKLPCLAGQDCEKEAKTEAQELLQTFKFFTLVAMTEPEGKIQCVVFEQTYVDRNELSKLPYGRYNVTYMDGTVKRHTEAVVFLSTLKPYGRIYSAITHPNKKWQFTPIFRNEGSCFLLKYRSEWKNGGNYYVIKSLDAGKDDYEPCIEKMKECSGKNVTYVNEGENCGKAEEGC